MRGKLLSATIVVLTPVLLAGVARGGRAKPHPESAPQLQEVVPVPRYDNGPAPRIEVWTRPGQGAVLRDGQRVDVFVRTDRDAYVLVYNVDTRGRVRLLFPRSPHDDGWVQGRTRIAIPGRHAGYELRVFGPPGVERIVALSSNRPLAYRWREVVDWDLAGAAPRGRVVDRVVQTSVGAEKPELRRVTSVRPRVVPTPIRVRQRIRRDETWFRVAGRRSWPRDPRWEDDWGD